MAYIGQSFSGRHTHETSILVMWTRAVHSEEVLTSLPCSWRCLCIGSWPAKSLQVIAFCSREYPVAVFCSHPTSDFVPVSSFCRAGP